MTKVTTAKRITKINKVRRPSLEVIDVKPKKKPAAVRKKSARVIKVDFEPAPVKALVMVYRPHPNQPKFIGPFADVLFPALTSYQRVVGYKSAHDKEGQEVKEPLLASKTKVRNHRVPVRVISGDERNGHGEVLTTTVIGDENIKLPAGMPVRFAGGTALNPAKAVEFEPAKA